MNKIQKLKRRRTLIIFALIVVLALNVLLDVWVATRNGWRISFVFWIVVFFEMAVLFLPFYLLIHEVNKKIGTEKELQKILNEFEELYQKNEIQVYLKIAQYIKPKVRFFASLNPEEECVYIYSSIEGENKRELFEKVTIWELYRKYSKTPV